MKKKRLSEKSKVPDVISPESIVELVRDYVVHAHDGTPLGKEESGKRYRIGYYSRQDGLDVIWLVDDNGNYCKTIDRDFLLKYYKIIRLSNIRDYFGVNRKSLSPIKTEGKKRGLGASIKSRIR